MGLSDLFKSSTSSLEPKWQKNMRRELATTAKPAALERINRAGEGYTGQLTAGMSDLEKQGMDVLSQYLSSPSSTDSDMYKAAQNEITKTLTGEYDPAGSEYYKAFRTSVMRELRDANDKLAAQTSARDAYYGGGRIKAQGDLQEGATNQLAKTLGELALQERQNRLTAVPLAQQLAQYGDQSQIAKVDAATTYGSLPRQIQQAEYDANYQEWLRQLNDLGLSLDVVTGLSTYQPPTAVAPSVFSQVAGAAGDVAKAYASKGE